MNWSFFQTTGQDISGSIMKHAVSQDISSRFMDRGFAVSEQNFFGLELRLLKKMLNRVIKPSGSRLHADCIDVYEFEVRGSKLSAITL